MCRRPLVKNSSKRDAGPKNVIPGTWYALVFVSSEPETTPPVHELVVMTTSRRVVVQR